MKGIVWIKNKLLMVLLLTITALSYAGVPLWTFTPLTVTSISVSASGTATIQYLVTNQSAKSHSLVMTPITGITQTTTGAGICSNPFTLPSRGSSCTLSLTVSGSQLTHSITDGPIVCEQGSTLQCYRPSSSNVLSINVGGSEYTIGGTVSGLSGSVVLQNNGTDNETVSSDGAFTFTTAIAEGSPYAVTVLTQPSGQTCTVTNGSGTVGSSNITNVGVNCVSNDTTLSASVPTLALSVNNTSLNAALTGKPRLIAITNTGSNPAASVTYSPSPALPSGTTISPSSCGTIAASSTCILIITPGSAPSAASGDITPTPITLSISGTNTNTLTPTVNILTYGSVYQGGYVYAVDDTTSDMGSIGGKVVTTSDQASIPPNGIIWGSNGAGAAASNVSSDIIPGINQTSMSTTGSPTYTQFGQMFSGNTYTNPNPFSSSPFSMCDGALDGSCNTGNILTFYNQVITQYNNSMSSPYTYALGTTNTTYYAAGLCKQTINAYSDWYLPAICEMGYGASPCGTSGAPTLQNIQSSLINSSSFSAPMGFYWSSTEDSANPGSNAWRFNFRTSGSSMQVANKSGLLGVRCSRALTL